MDFNQLPVLYNKDGNVRTVGFELEFANVGVEESTAIIQELFGGQIQKENRFKQKVVDTELGDFTVEFDLTLLTEKRYKKIFDKLKIQPDQIKLKTGTLEDEIEETLESVVGKVFPYEIACPPIPSTRLYQLEKLREALYRNHAEGTKSFITNAYGTHINVEAPDLETETLLNYLKAFLLLYPWLLEKGETDIARKISPFIAPYPSSYLQLILAPGYSPDLETFIHDYHTFNPDRNRPLDMYPILASLHPDFLAQFSDLGKVKARNTFHYRLPNSSISQPNWTLAQEWNNWVTIEELANNHKKLRQLSIEHLTLKESTLTGFENKWIGILEQELNL